MPAARAQPSPARGDQHRGRRREQRRHELIGEDAVARQQPDRGIDREQADRLAVPHVDIRYRAVEHAIADQQVILLVDMDQRIAEVARANDDGDRQQDQEQRDAAPFRQPFADPGHPALHGSSLTPHGASRDRKNEGFVNFFFR
jgi:hypothetical protein